MKLVNQKRNYNGDYRYFMKPSGFLRPKGAIGKEPLRTVDLQHQSLRRELQNAGAWGLGLQGFVGLGV